jgi:HEXXH motif-containing protein
MDWMQVYTKTFKLLKKIDSGIYDELNSIIEQIIPFGTARNVHNSASYKECIGQIYLGYTLCDSQPEVHILEALIHESSHNKLNLLLHFDPLLKNPYEEKYYSAIRPDARPLS